MSLEITYNVEKASAEVREAMRDRCYEQGHEYENCCTVVFQIYERCKWCGELGYVGRRYL